MPSSISSSEMRSAPAYPRDRRRRVSRAHIFAILATLLGCCAGIEAGTRFLLARLSRIEHRVMNEHASAVQLQPTSSSPILLVGDSLLLMDVDMNALIRTAPPGLHFQRFSIEQTFYLDWLFGLRRIFSEGVRPTAVILCMAPNSFVSTASRGDYTAYHLLGLRDIP